MAKPPCKDLYQVRTLAYYQAKGGIYNDLITYLTQLRRQPQHRGMASPATLLNEACYHLDYSQTLPPEEAAAYIAKLPENIRDLIQRMQKKKKQQASITLQAIIDHILAHKQYQFVNQIINMLKDLIGRTCTEEEYQQILAVEQQVMDNSAMEIHNHNHMSNCNVLTGSVYNPQFPTHEQ